MKKLMLSILLATAFITTKAQDCTGFFPLHEGVKMEMTYYDKKGDVSMVAQQDITEVTQVGDTYKVTVHSKTRDDKGKDMTELTMKATCENGNFEMDLSEMMDQATRENLENLQFTLTGDKISLPTELSVGQKLPDAEMVMSTNGALKMKATYTIEDRKVASKESITVPAGTYECYLITSRQNLKMMASAENTMKQWINPKVGLVQAEVYNKKGKLTGSQKLTNISLP